mmetsp:Transcript_14931/g.36715  ORF Transcript_14931/g.36715 Transcript_14931/m.36715 type:complete len:209 (+) Transcript_14931:270-896(+)
MERSCSPVTPAARAASRMALMPPLLILAIKLVHHLERIVQNPSLPASCSSTRLGSAPPTLTCSITAFRCPRYALAFVALMAMVRVSESISAPNTFTFGPAMSFPGSHLTPSFSSSSVSKRSKIAPAMASAAEQKSSANASKESAARTSCFAISRFPARSSSSATSCATCAAPTPSAAASAKRSSIDGPCAPAGAVNPNGAQAPAPYKP